MVVVRSATRPARLVADPRIAVESLAEPDDPETGPHSFQDRRDAATLDAGFIWWPLPVGGRP